MSSCLVTLTRPVVCLPLLGQCPKPEIDSNVILTNEDLLKNKFPEGSTATFDCAVGYMRDGGSATISCTDGMWSSLSLKCKKISCSSPGEIVNGRFDLSAGTEYGAVIRAVCDKGYEPEGPSYMKCTDKGWSGQNPTCKGNGRCPEPPDIENGRVALKPFNKQFPEYSDKVVYSCQEGYNIIGSAVIECKENGQYVPSPPQCKDTTFWNGLLIIIIIMIIIINNYHY
ncbi:complement factor H-like [Arapaima gigas]